MNKGDHVIIKATGAKGTIESVEWTLGGPNDLWSERILHVKYEDSPVEFAISERAVTLED